MSVCVCNINGAERPSSESERDSPAHTRNPCSLHGCGHVLEIWGKTDSLPLLSKTQGKTLTITWERTEHVLGL